MANYNGWTLLWTFLGFLLIFAGTARDSWTQTADRVGSLTIGSGNSISGSRLARDFGTTSYTESFQDGFGYGNPNVCASSKRLDDMNDTSAAMVALLILANLTGFFASFLAILAASNSTVVRSFGAAKALAAAAALFCLLSWIVWLAAGNERLANKINDNNDSPDNNSTCRWKTDIPFSGSSFTSSDWISVRNVNNTPGGSTGLAIAASILYILLVLAIGNYAKKAAASATKPAALPVVVIALLALAAIFVASVYNIWTSGTGRGHNIIERNLKNFVADPVRNSTGKDIDVETSARYGVYSAKYFQSHELPYDDRENRGYICSGDLESDDASKGLVRGGRVVLGFAVVASLLALLATLAAIGGNPKSFWLSTLALICAIVALAVWSLVDDYVIRDRCCTAPTCTLGDSFGLVGAGALFLLAGIFYQAWVISDDIYVLHPPHAYGMASKQVPLQPVGVQPVGAQPVGVQPVAMA